MNPSDYLAQDAVGLAGLIARREVSAAEVLEAALARAEAVNPKLNAIILSMADEARASVRDGAPQGPLGGVPFLIKDIGAQVRGVPTSAGSRLLKDKVATADSAIVAAYRRAGLIFFGKTNTPEFGLEPVTEPELFGPTLNPWNLERTPGGSSGGSAAAVAAGIAPAAHASDGGGSIRIPASCCGLFGMKPTRGRVSMAPGDEGWGGLSIQHAVSRSVRDNAALLDAVCAPQRGDPYWAQPAAGPFLACVDRDPGRLKIGFTTAALASSGLDPECVEAVRAAARLCESLGHQVEEAELPGDIAGATAAVGLIVAANIAAVLEIETARRGRPVERGEIEDLTLGVYERGKTIGAPQYIQAIQAAHAYGRAVAPFFERFDVLLLSTLGRPPVPKGWLRGDPPDLRGYNERLFDFMPNTQAFNITGAPAMTVPLAWSSEGLPIGVQFVGRPADEATLFSLAGQLERAQPWADRRPAGFA
jgi:amidase